MEPKTLLNADYLDIIFDNRNKTYGGYELRKNYNRRIKKVAGIMFLGMTALFSFSFVTVKHTEIIVKPSAKPTLISDVHIMPPPQIPHPIIPPSLSQQHVNTHIFTPPKIVDDTQVPDDKQMPHNTDMHNAQPGTSNATGDSTGMGSGGGKENSTGVVETASNGPELPKVWVEQMPQFPGDINEYIGSHLHYPTVASNEGITGKVMVEFVVNEDGGVSDVKVLRGIGGGCDEEAARTIKAMPKWKPGKQNGTPVKVLFRLPITFVLN